MLRRWLYREKVHAVHTRDLETVLIELGIIQQVEAGTIHCAGCGESVTLEKIQCLFMENNEVKVCCDNMH